MKNIVIVAGLFHLKYVQRMVIEARKTAEENNLNITKEIWVPGSLEKPLALDRALSDKNIDGAIVLGIIERGQTKHGLVMGMAVMTAIINLQLKHNKPIGVGILGPEIKPDQIPPRLKLYASSSVLAVKSLLDQ